MDTQTQIEVEQDMEVVIDMEKTHIFDPKTLLVIVQTMIYQLHFKSELVRNKYTIFYSIDINKLLVKS